jgi:hypothetical protein
MTDIVAVALITGSASMFVGLVPGTMAAISAARARRAAERAERLSHETKEVNTQTAHRIDGRMDELLELTRLAAFKAGALEQKELGDRISAAVKEAQTPTVVIATPQMPQAQTPTVVIATPQMPPAVKRQEDDSSK